MTKVSTYTPHILQGTLRLEWGKPRAGLAREFQLERRALAAAATVLGILVCAYLALVAATILNIMGRNQAERRVEAIGNNIASLEERYLALSKRVTPEEASRLGLAPIDSVSYVYRPGNAALATPAQTAI